MTSVVLAVDSRFKAGILLAGGFNSVATLPEVDAINFVPRVIIPILVINGESDFIFPLHSAQKPLMSRLGTPAEHKRHSVYPGGHDLMAQLRSHVIREVLDWLDQYLGPVERETVTGRRLEIEDRRHHRDRGWPLFTGTARNLRQSSSANPRELDGTEGRRGE